jgi:hypothetical protein
VSAVSSVFLRAKAWHLFLLFIVVFLVEETVLTATAARRSDLLLGSMSAFDMLLIMAWIWSAGSFLNSIIHPYFRFNVSLFRVAVIVPVVYAFVGPANLVNIHISVISVKASLHVFAWICSAYVISLVSKSLVVAETGEPTSFLDYAVEFLLVSLFVIIGVWNIQPRINHLYAKGLDTSASNNSMTHGTVQLPG